jgi:major membrane immunogen (membrane-anchored lipoprotein)
MKKLLVLLVFSLMNLVSFSAMKDGIYYVEKSYDNEWKSFVKVIVKNDKIIGAQYDRKNSEGVLLSLDQKENDKAKAKYGSSFRETSFLLTRGLVSAQKVEPNETVKDSSSLDEFTKMVDYLIEKANSGEDGVYKL